MPDKSQHAVAVAITGASGALYATRTVAALLSLGVHVELVVSSYGRRLLRDELGEDASAYKFPGGASAQVALYTPYWHHFAIIRRILLRMRSWQNFVFFEGH